MVERGKHVRRSGIGSHPVLLAVIAGAVLLVAGSAFAATRYDQSRSDKIMPGVTIAGVNVAGMTRPEAIRAVKAVAHTKLSSQLQVHVGQRSWKVTPAELGVRADVPGAVDRALAVTDGMGFFDRVYRRVTGSGVARTFDVGYRYNQQQVSDFVDGLVKSVEKPATNAGLTIVGDQLVKQRAHYGQTLKTTLAAAKIRTSLLQDQAAVKVPLQKVTPEVTNDKLGTTIVINKSVNRLYLYRGFDLVASYPVATAMPGYDTPSGTWQIVNKAENPTWINPNQPWSKDLPATIPPGPSDPLGTRALYLNAPGIRIHGTYDSASVGTYASHGCIRMLIADSEALYPQVPIGATVLIY